MLSIRLFGPPQISLDNNPLNINRRKSRALVYYLAANSDPQPRDHLLAILWPELDRSSAQQSLRTTLYGLRKSLADQLDITDTELSLTPGAEIDTRLFLSNTQYPVTNYPTPDLATVYLTKALGIYRGEFLEGFSLTDSAPYDDWQRTQAEYYRRLAIRGYTTLSQLYETQQIYREALNALDQALSFDPLQEDLQRTALRLHYYAGDRAGAIRRYDNLRNLLDEEMGVPPMAETRAIYDAIIMDTLPAPQSPPLQITNYPKINLQSPIAFPKASNTISEVDKRTSSIPFTGRATELQILHNLTSQRQLLLIEGGPGIGKTRLAQEFTRTTNALVLMGNARELEQSIPYQPITEALRGLLNHPEWPELRTRLNLPPVWLDETSRLLPELAPARPAWSSPPRPGPPGIPGASPESRLWEGVTRFITEIASQQPIILFLDDLHWADESTLVILSYLIRNSHQSKITFLGTTRPPATQTPLGIFLQNLTRENRLTRLVLDRLPLADVQSLGNHLAQEESELFSEWLMRNSEGIPFVISELIRYAREQNILTPNGLNSDQLSSDPIVPQTVYSLLQSRLLRLSEEARRILDVAVVVGRKFDFELVQRASGLSETAALDALDELRTSGFVNPREGWDYEIDHLLIMEVAWREVGEARHRLLHRRVAETLEKTHQHPEEVAGLLAFHYSEGYSLPKAAPYAFLAGQQAARLAAWREAISFYELALKEISDHEKYDLLLALGEAQELSGNHILAFENYRAALALVQKDRPRSDRVRLSITRSLIMQGRFHEVIALAQEVLQGENSENQFQAEFQWGTALALEGADMEKAIEHLTIAQNLARKTEDPAKLAPVTFELGNIAAQQGDLVNAIVRYRQALDMANEMEDETAFLWQTLIHNNLAYHLLLSGDHASARDHVQTGLNQAEARGVLTLLPYLHSTIGEIELAEGNLDSAEVHFKMGLELAQRQSSPERIAGLSANLGLVAIKRGEIPLAIQHLSTALARADSLGIRHLGAQIRIWLAPLLPPDERITNLEEAQAIAQEGGRKGLLDQIKKLETS